MERILSDNLSKTYPGGKQALCHMNLSLGTGEVFGFLGPNGAGKTTTVKLLTGILTPTEGSCLVMGYNPSKEPEKTHSLTGVVTEHAQMYDHLRAWKICCFTPRFLIFLPRREKTGPGIFLSVLAFGRQPSSLCPPTLLVCVRGCL